MDLFLNSVEESNNEIDKKKKIKFKRTLSLILCHFVWWQMLNEFEHSHLINILTWPQLMHQSITQANRKLLLRFDLIFLSFCRLSVEARKMIMKFPQFRIDDGNIVRAFDRALFSLSHRKCERKRTAKEREKQTETEENKNCAIASILSLFTLVIWTRTKMLCYWLLCITFNHIMTL